MSEMNTQRKELLDTVSGYQVGVIAICVAINIFEAFDLFAMAYAAPVLSQAWGLEPESLGIVLSAVFVGMALGSALVAPLSDHFGRRTVMCAALAVLTGAMFLTATASTISHLVVYRVLAGMAIGTILPTVTTTVAEFAPDRHRNLCVGILHVAAPAGGILGGIVALALMAKYGWTSVFVAGGAVTALVALLALALVPESPEFLLRQPEGRGLAKLNATLARMGQRPVDAETAASLTRRPGSTGIRGLFEDNRVEWSVLLWVCFFCVIFGLYFVNTWLPQVIVSAGLPLDRAIYVTVIFNTGGAIGVFWMGLRSHARGVRPMLMGFLLSSFALMALFGFMPLNVTLLSVLAFFAGLFVNGSFVALYIAAVRLYDTRSRSSGLGWGIGIGRIGAILSPVIAGLLIGLGLSRGLNFLIYATPFLVAAIAIAALKSPRLAARDGSEPS